MSNWTYVCAHCGSVRRRPAVYGSARGGRSPSYPQCCESEMVALTKGYAEAATKLSRERRVVWLAAGGYIHRKPGRKWTAAFSPREIATAQEKFVGITATKRLQPNER